MDRRKQYRVQPAESDDVQVSFAKPGGPQVPGLVLDVSAGGAMVQLALAGCPDLAMDEEVELSFTLDQLEQPLVIPARVAHRTETESSRAGWISSKHSYQSPDTFTLFLPFRLNCIRYFISTKGYVMTCYSKLHQQR